MLTIIERLLQAWTGLAYRLGWLCIAGFVATAGLATHYAAGNLRVNTDTSKMLDETLPFQARSIALRGAFPQIKTDLVVVARAPTLDEADAFAARLAERLAAKPDLFGGVFAPAQDLFFLQNGLLYLDEGELESRLTQMSKAAGLIETLVASPRADTLFDQLANNDELAEKSDLGQETLLHIYRELAAVIYSALADEWKPFSWMGAIDTSAGETPDGFSRLVYATPALDYARLQPAKPSISALRDEIALLSADFNGRVEAYVTGDPALRAEELQSVTQGIGLSFLLSIVMVLFLLIVAFRSSLLALVTLAGLAITLMLTTAFAAAAIGELNLVSIAFTVLLVGLGLDFAIHLLLHIQERRAAGQDSRGALAGAVREVGPAMALAAPTTALAFLSFVPTAFDGIAQLGVIAGAGVLIAFLVSITFLPACLAVLPGLKVRKGAGAVRRAFSGLEKVSAPIAVISVGLGVAALFVLPQARFEADPMALRNPESPSVKGFQLLFEDSATIPYRLTRLVPSAEDAERTSRIVKALPSVGGARSLPDFVPEDQDIKLELIDIAASSLAFALGGSAPPAPINNSASEQEPILAGAARLRDRLANQRDPARAMLAQALSSLLEASGERPQIAERAEKAIFAFWPQLIARLDAQLGADYVQLDDLPPSLRKRYLSDDGQWRVDILPQEDVRDRKALLRFVEDVEREFPDIGGGAIHNLKAGAVISTAMMQATLIAFAVISIFLLLLVRRASSVLLMLGPLALAATLTTATGVLIDAPFNYANVIVLPLLIGIGVDSGIHLVMRQEQVSTNERVYETSTPRAVLFSALTTVASFGSLMLSAHQGTASMGRLLSIAIAFTLICTLVVLPAAFRLSRKQGR